MEINYRHNIMDIGSISTFARVRGGYNQGNRDVYFIRATGGNDTLIRDIQEMDVLLDTAMEHRQLLYKRVGHLPMDIDEAERQYYFNSYENWIASNCTSMKIHMQSDNEEFCTVFGAALKTAEMAYDKVKVGNTPSIKRNFIIKLMRWTDFILKDYPIKWNERSCIKIIADNVVKVQEYLFYYMLTLIGADVLLIQTTKDIEIADWLQNYSKKLVLGDYVPWSLPEYEHTAAAEQKVGKNEAMDVSQSSGEAVQNSQGAVRVNIPEHAGRRKSADAAEMGKPVQTAQPVKMQQNPPVAATSHSKEKSFEELALLASSIVMITIYNQNGEPMGSGSGIMIGEKGYILTNYHVVREGCFFSVQIEDDETVYKTDEIIKYHSVLDLAIIRIPRRLNPLPIYNGSAGLVRGQKVVAIGSPLGLFNSVSDGIISGFRTIDSVDMIQFTAPTSPGSSGGAVLNMSGEVIGISTAGIDRGQNLNLAVLYGDIGLFIKGFC